jgi:hypothetical protein
MYKLNNPNGGAFGPPVQAMQIQIIGSFKNEGFLFHDCVLSRVG